MHPTLRIIRDEHSTLSAVLRSIDLLLSECRCRGIPPDFAVLRALLFYIDEVPEKQHHPKESALLFPKLRERSAALATVLDRLDADHAQSHAAVRALEHDLLGLEMMSDSADAETRLLRFEDVMHAYVVSYLEHIRVEELQVLPLAERVLTAADWAELDAAFMQNRDPLKQGEPDDEFTPLFKKILMTLPAPIGLGPAMEALAKRTVATGHRSPAAEARLQGRARAQTSTNPPAASRWRESTTKPSAGHRGGEAGST
jgi:hemerythrin-like domain-containing protein